MSLIQEFQFILDIIHWVIKKVFVEKFANQTAAEVERLHKCTGDLGTVNKFVGKGTKKNIFSIKIVFSGFGNFHYLKSSFQFKVGVADAVSCFLLLHQKRTGFRIAEHILGRSVCFQSFCL